MARAQDTAGPHPQVPPPGLPEPAPVHPSLPLPLLPSCGPESRGLLWPPSSGEMYPGPLCPWETYYSGRYPSCQLPGGHLHCISICCCEEEHGTTGKANVVPRNIVSVLIFHTGYLNVEEAAAESAARHLTGVEISWQAAKVSRCCGDSDRFPHIRRRETKD